MLLRPDASPTGLPVVPPALVPYIAILVVIATVALPLIPPEHWAHKVCTVIVGTGGVLGIMSPGARRGRQRR